MSGASGASGAGGGGDEGGGDRRTPPGGAATILASKKIPGCIKVLCKDGKTEVDWLEDMIQYTTTQPSLSFSCNPMNFDFAQLGAKKTQSPAAAAEDFQANDPDMNGDIDQSVQIDLVKKRSKHSKKSKKKHRHHHKSVVMPTEGTETIKDDSKGETKDEQVSSLVDFLICNQVI